MTRLVTRRGDTGQLRSTDTAWVVLAGLALGALAGIVAALLRPRRRSAAGGYSPVLEVPSGPDAPP